MNRIYARFTWENNSTFVGECFDYSLGLAKRPDGDDLRQQPLIVRKDRLSLLVRSAECERIIYAQHIEGRGKRFFEEICRWDLEGIVAKRKLSVYRETMATAG